MEEIYTRTQYIPLTRLHSVVESNINKIFSLVKCPINREEFILIRSIKAEEGLSQTALAARVGKERNDISKVCKTLEAKKIITRNSCSIDKRFYSIYLTPYGNQLEERAEQALVKWHKFAQKDISDEHWELFNTTMQKYLDNLLGVLLMKDEDLLPEDLPPAPRPQAIRPKKYKSKINVRKLH